MSEFDRNAFEEMYSDADETLDHYDMAKHIYITQQAKIDELQARIDEALNYLRHTDFRECEESILFNILKGSKDEK